MDVTSPAFDDGQPVPTEHTCQGQDTSPPLELHRVPEGARTLAVIVDDPDAPQPQPWVHWLIWNIPAAVDTLGEGYPPSGDGKRFDAARQGTTDFSGDARRYRGPCPPEGHGEHRYRFTVYALDDELDVPAGAKRGALEAAMQEHVLERAQLTGTYER